ncbi:fasciclin, partial [Pseudomonas frederiksbergensis]|nr:fasciclin [Pseudomonas frederiksbergensis]
METYLKKHGLASVQDLTQGECDTIARSHLANNTYGTIDMNDGTLNTENLNKRFIQITHGMDKDSNTVVELNRM